MSSHVPPFSRDRIVIDLDDSQEVEDLENFLDRVHSSMPYYEIYESSLLGQIYLNHNLSHPRLHMFEPFDFSSDENIAALLERIAIWKHKKAMTRGRGRLHQEKLVSRLYEKPEKDEKTRLRENLLPRSVKAAYIDFKLHVSTSPLSSSLHAELFSIAVIHMRRYVSGKISMKRLLDALERAEISLLDRIAKFYENNRLTVSQLILQNYKRP
ncbi:MAG: hypothetical protein ACTSVZ_12230 [Promethearchaeota archaeon]